MPLDRARKLGRAFAAAALLATACDQAATPPSDPAPPDDPPFVLPPRPTGLAPAGSGPIGRGYDPATQVLLEPCFAADPTWISYPEASFSTAPASASDVLASLGFGWGDRARYGLSGTDAGASFGRAIVPSPLSSTRVYVLGSYTFGGWARTTPVETWLVPPDSAGFAARCGSEFLRMQVMGASMLLVYRVDFADEAALATFGAEFASDSLGALGDATATAVAASRGLLDGRLAVHVEAYQRGGDVSALSGALSATGAHPATAGWAVDCALPELSACGRFVDDVVAAAFGAAFADSIEASPAVVEVDFSDWAMLGAPWAPRSVPWEVTSARLALRAELDRQIALRERIATLGRGDLAVPVALAERLPALDATVTANLAALEQAAADCFDRLGDLSAERVAACVDAATPEGLAARGLDASPSVGDLVAGP